MPCHVMSWPCPGPVFVPRLYVLHFHDVLNGLVRLRLCTLARVSRSSLHLIMHHQCTLWCRLAAAAATGAALSAGVEGSAAENERLGVIAARDQVI